jgi:hypothetical protein
MILLKILKTLLLCEVFEIGDHELLKQGNLLKGIVIWFVRRKGIEPIIRISSLLLVSVIHFL